MEFLTPYFNMAYVVAVAIGMVILIVGFLIYKAFGGPVMGRKGQRLGISEYHEIDKTRRLVLVRRDETEHLILIGGAQDVVIESGIGLSNGVEDMHEPLHEPLHPPIPIRSAPRAPLFVERRPVLRPVEPPMMSQRNYEHEEN